MLVPEAMGCALGSCRARSTTNPDINSSTKPDNNIEAAVRAFSQSQIPAAWQDDNWRQEFKNIWMQTAHRLRNFLHQGTIKACYFDDNGPQVVAINFWLTDAADEVLETGKYWPFGRPNTSWDWRPSCRLFLLQSELDKLLSDEPGRRPFPQAKLPDLVAALRRLDDLPNREKQRAAIRKLPEFEPYHITDDMFREAQKQAPREAGRRRSPPEPKPPTETE